LIWLLRVSQALEVLSFLRCVSGRSKMVKPSGRFSSAQATSLGCFSRQVSRKTRSRSSAWGRDSALKMAAQEVDATFFPLEPFPDGGAGAIPDVEDFASSGGSLAQCEHILPFEGAHVVFFVALNLIAHCQMGHAVTPQAEGVEVAGGVFGSGEGGDSAGSFFVDRTFARLGLIVAGGGDEVTIARVESEVRETLESGEGIGLGQAHVDLHLSENLTEQSKPPPALETLGKGGPKDVGVVAICEILKKIATALKESKTAADANFEPEFIRKRGAVASGSGEIEKPIKRF
jgi:hypothetical protein